MSEEITERCADTISFLGELRGGAGVLDDLRTIRRTVINIEPRTRCEGKIQIEIAFNFLVEISRFGKLEILSRRRGCALVNERQIIAHCLVAAGYERADIARVMNRDYTSISHLLNKRKMKYT